MMKSIRIGVVGYSVQKFNVEDATFLLTSAIDYLKLIHQAKYIEIVSGYTNLGVPAVAYAIAEKHRYATRGVACEKANEYPCFDCDEVDIVGENWGDESDAFLKSIDVLVRIGGGMQSNDEAFRAKAMGIPTMEFELPVLGEDQL